MADKAEMVHILLIFHRHGHNTYLHRTEEGEQASLIGYVRENWEDEIKDEPAPEDDDKAIERYFELLAEEESYSIDTIEIGP
jgi:hypothetical protein